MSTELQDALKSAEIAQDDQPTLLDTEIIQKLSALNVIDYDRQREELAKTLGVRASTLDKEVKAVRGAEKEAGRLPFVNIDPYPEPINPAQLFNEVSGAIRQFIVLDEHQAQAAALWVTSLMLRKLLPWLSSTHRKRHAVKLNS